MVVVVDLYLGAAGVRFRCSVGKDGMPLAVLGHDQDDPLPGCCPFLDIRIQGVQTGAAVQDIVGGDHVAVALIRERRRVLHDLERLDELRQADPQGTAFVCRGQLAVQGSAAPEHARRERGPPGEQVRRRSHPHTVPAPLLLGARLVGIFRAGVLPIDAVIGLERDHISRRVAERFRAVAELVAAGLDTIPCNGQRVRRGAGLIVRPFRCFHRDLRATLALDRDTARCGVHGGDALVAGSIRQGSVCLRRELVREGGIAGLLPYRVGGEFKCRRRFFYGELQGLCPCIGADACHRRSRRTGVDVVPVYHRIIRIQGKLLRSILHCHDRFLFFSVICVACS